MQPRTIKLHKHVELLKQIRARIQAAQSKVYLYKVKAHSGVVGNEGADALARWSARHATHHDTGMTEPKVPYTDTIWLK